ncbi:MAG: hypothetical protein IPJ33_02515 [Gammaproteobacteria bacterium]|jgi:hypothetical protein|nr:hypothetical protein [Gammaproteobacteria bacterium]MBP6050287.1 hypothetical protein [Pseudomonadales bacterium]MBK6583794.1 hypothetical protein [Gammaproteobacteria bacterium]MBK7171158.1 hypothetical protein [Gammaproteobacteria bacterium]MBK7522131.1 hypothetical protein [Gammaproteobacteria bacterium]
MSGNEIAKAGIDALIDCAKELDIGVASFQSDLSERLALHHGPRDEVMLVQTQHAQVFQTWATVGRSILRRSR